MPFLGSQRVIEELVKSYYASLYRYAFRLTGSAAEAEDLVQETYCKAQLKLAQLREPDRARAWLYSILRNTYLHRRRDERPGSFVPLTEVEEPAAEAPDEPFEIEPERLQAVLNQLPESFRTPIILFYFEEFSYRDIAEQMELPMGTVMSRLARGKAYLRRLLLAPAPQPVTSEEGRLHHGL